MSGRSKIGVVICECGYKIESLIDLDLIQKEIEFYQDVSFCKILPYTCLQPGIDELVQGISEKKINRLIIGGCESRLILDKFERKLKIFGLLKGQIEILNLRGHIASSNSISPEKKAIKAIKNIKAAIAEMKVLNPTPEEKIVIDKPIMIFGGGISIWPIAKRMNDEKNKFLLQEKVFKRDFIYEILKNKYPGYENFHQYFEEIREEITESKYLKIIPDGDFVSMGGETGNYEMVFVSPQGNHDVIEVGMVISCFDCDLVNDRKKFGYDGKNVVIQNELIVTLEKRGILEGEVVFWINDYESKHPEFAKISMNSALQLAKTIIRNFNKIEVTILYNEKMGINFNAHDAKIKLIKYNKYTNPIIQDGFVVITDTNDKVVKNIPWDIFVLSPKRIVNEDDLKFGEILSLTKKSDGFLDSFNPKVLPNQIGGGGIYISGSSQFPCEFEDLLVSAHSLSREIALMIDNSKKGKLIVPRIVCTVDEEKCVGCGLAQDICENSCFKVSSFGKVAKIDPMLCTGGGTCTASCPYGALNLKNSTTEQREIRVGSLAEQIEPDEIIVAGCFWGGLPSADNASKKGLFYDSRAHILGVPCVGQLDPKILVRAFLNGASGFLLVGCYPNQCHHSYGIDHAWSRVNVIRKLLQMCDIDVRRISLAYADFNKPDEFVEIIDSFTRLMAKIGPVEKNESNKEKLQSMYDLTANNTRVRHLLCASLRSHKELEGYLGDQSSSLEADRDFNKELKEEFIQTRIINLLRTKGKKLKAEEIEKNLKIESYFLSKALPDLNKRKLIRSTYVGRIPKYSI